MVIVNKYRWYMGAIYFWSLKKDVYDNYQTIAIKHCDIFVLRFFGNFILYKFIIG